MNQLFALWTKELLALLRDKHGLAALFLMPIIFILVMTMALHDAFMPGASIDVAFAVVDLDNSAHSRTLVRRLEKSSSFRSTAAVQDAEAAKALIRSGRLGLALVIPHEFGSRLLTPGNADGQVTAPLTLMLDPALNPALRLAFHSQITAALGAVRADELTQRAGALFGLPTAKAGGTRDWPDEIVSLAIQNERTIRPPSSVQQNVPAWLVFAMFFVVIPIASIFIGERQHGTLQRLVTMRVPFRSVLLGKLLPYFIVNQLQALLMVLVGMFIVPLLGGEALVMPSNFALFCWWTVAAAVSLGAVAWALLVASLAQTSQQATIIGGVGNILMGAIGGIMVPKFMMPATMQQLAEFSPMAWGLEGFHIIMLRQGSFADILPGVAKLVLFAVLSLALAIWLNHRKNP
jgi:ABC-2 type transport system permease protein